MRGFGYKLATLVLVAACGSTVTVRHDDGVACCVSSCK
jgi:hypothetical protein